MNVFRSMREPWWTFLDAGRDADAVHAACPLRHSAPHALAIATRRVQAPLSKHLSDAAPFARGVQDIVAAAEQAVARAAEGAPLGRLWEDRPAS